MDGPGHGADVARDIAIDSVGGEETVPGAVDAGSGSSGVGRSIVEVAVSVVVGAGGEAVARSVAGVELRSELELPG